MNSGYRPNPAIAPGGPLYPDAARHSALMEPRRRVLTAALALAVLYALVAVLAQSASAAETRIQPLEELRVLAARFVTDQTRQLDSDARVHVDSLDPRLRLPLCADPPMPFYPQGGRRIGNLTVGVRCPGSRPWTVYLSASAKIIRRVAVLSRPVQRDAVLSERDIRFEERDVTSLLSGYVTEREDLEGMRVTRSLIGGYVLNPGVVAPPTVVRRGEKVTLVARTGGLEVRSRGVAMEDGARGQRISVKNLNSKRIVVGVVSPQGMILIRM